MNAPVARNEGIEMRRTFVIVLLAGIGLVAIGGLAVASWTFDTVPAVPSTAVAAVGSPVTSPAASAAVVASTAPTSDLTRTFTSPWNGYSIAIARDWTVIPAQLRWLEGRLTPPFGDVVSVAGTSTRFTIASQSLRDQSFDAWLEAYLPPNERGPCAGQAPSTWPTIDVGGEPGRWRQTCTGGDAVVSAGGWVYLIAVANGSFDRPQQLDRAAIERVLATVRLDPATAQRGPLLPALDATYASTFNQLTIHYPEGWRLQRATGPSGWDGSARWDPDGSWDRVFVGDVELAVSSATLPDGEAGTAWLQGYCGGGVKPAVVDPHCPTASNPSTSAQTGTAPAWVVTSQDPVSPLVRGSYRATTTSGSRVYVVDAHGSIEHSAFDVLLRGIALEPVQPVTSQLAVPITYTPGSGWKVMTDTPTSLELAFPSPNGGTWLSIGLPAGRPAVAAISRTLIQHGCDPIGDAPTRIGSISGAGFWCSGVETGHAFTPLYPMTALAVAAGQAAGSGGDAGWLGLKEGETATVVVTSMQGTPLIGALINASNGPRSSGGDLRDLQLTVEP